MFRCATSLFRYYSKSNYNAGSNKITIRCANSAFKESISIKIGTQCVHVASQQKHQLTIKDKILIKHKAINAILFVFFTIPAMQLLDLV